MEAMQQLLQGNPQLWQVAGDLFVKHMDWPGAQEMAARIRKTIDPKLLQDEDNSPALQAANQQIQAMGAEMEQMHSLLKNVKNSMEAKTIEIDQFKAEISAYDAETNRIKAVAAGMTPEQIQDVVLGTVHGMIQSGDLMASMPQPAAPPQPDMPPQGGPPPDMPPQGAPPPPAAPMQ
jgi:hypothetical protein